MICTVSAQVVYVIVSGIISILLTNHIFRKWCNKAGLVQWNNAAIRVIKTMSSSPYLLVTVGKINH